MNGSNDELKLNQSIRTPVAGIVQGLLNGPSAWPTNQPTNPPANANIKDSMRIMMVMWSREAPKARMMAMSFFRSFMLL